MKCALPAFTKIDLGRLRAVLRYLDSTGYSCDDIGAMLQQVPTLLCMRVQPSRADWLRFNPPAAITSVGRRWAIYGGCSGERAARACSSLAVASGSGRCSVGWFIWSDPAPARHAPPRPAALYYLVDKRRN